LVRLRNLAPDALVVGQRVQNADALRAREDEVVAGDRRQGLLGLAPLARLEVELAHVDRALANRSSQPFVSRRIDASQQRSEVPVLDDADEAERLSAAPRPDARRLAATGVVVVDAKRDLLLV